jgi:D-tyrosyl-tRNA(Tyr) deacylase
MRVVIQRVSEAAITIDEQVFSSIGHGLLVLVGFEEGDSEKSIDWLCAKIVNMRIFSDAEGKMNLSALDVGGEILAASLRFMPQRAKAIDHRSFGLLRLRSANPCTTLS